MGIKTRRNARRVFCSVYTLLYFCTRLTSMYEQTNQNP